MNNHRLCEYELDVLRICAGINVPGMAWGAAMGQALETLRNMGLAESPGGAYRATNKGRELLGLDPL